MSKPSRPLRDRGIAILPRTFFITSRTAGGRSILQSERMAGLFIEVLRSCMRTGKFKILNFVVMPNHVHLLLELPEAMRVEAAMQFIKGGFSYRAKKELGFSGEVWQRGFSDVLVTEEQSLRTHREYIEQNPVKAGLARSAEEYAFGFPYLRKMKLTSGSQGRLG